MFYEHDFGNLCEPQEEQRNLTFAMMYKELRISLSFSVPKIDEICDMGL